jgi:hypothetical protein
MASASCPLGFSHHQNGVQLDALRQKQYSVDSSPPERFMMIAINNFSYVR